MTRILLSALALFAFTLPAVPADAQRGARDAEVRIERLLRDAREAYDNLELDAAESALDRAIRLGEDARVVSPTLAEVYIQRGILYHVRDKDAGRAVTDFTSALRLDDRARLDPLVSTPSLERLFDDARTAARRAPPPRRQPDPPPRGYDDRRDPPPRDPPPAAGGDKDVYHQPPPKAKAGESLVLSADIDDRINRVVYRVYLFFETARSEKMQKVEMEPKGNRSFAARIPRRYMLGSTLRYYIVAEDRQGRPVGVFGTAQRPILLPIEGDLLGGADELASGSTLGGGSGGGASGGHKYLSLGVSVGTGGGFVTRNAKLQNQVGFGVSPGFAPAPLHTLVEVDVWANDWLGFGGYARIQIVEFSWLVGGRLKVSVFEGGGSEIIVRAGGGYGLVRHLVTLPGDLLDTTLEGPFHWTLGASWRYAFTDMLGLVISPDFLHLIGDSPSYHFDLNVGVTFDF